MDPRIPTANRYVGWYQNNEIKIRGVEIRRRDTPVFVKRLQGEMLQIMGRAATVADLRDLLPVLLEKAGEFFAVLRAGRADPLELVIRRHLSREPEEYVNNSANAVAARTLNEAGVRLSPGETVEYIIVDGSGKRAPEKAKPVALYALDDGYDIEVYTEMALKAVETLLAPFGYSIDALRGLYAPKPLPRAEIARRKTLRSLPLFPDEPEEQQTVA
jgi:DNA polymerase-2